MKMQEAKTEKDIKLDGVKAEITRKDSYVIRIILRDTTGNVVEVAESRYNGIEVLIPAPPEKKKVWKVTGKIAGIPIDENFDGQYSADQRKEKLESLNAEELAVKEVEVEVA